MYSVQLQMDFDYVVCEIFSVLLHSVQLQMHFFDSVVYAYVVYCFTVTLGTIAPALFFMLSRIIRGPIDANVAVLFIMLSALM